jgi:hypothetical protein
LPAKFPVTSGLRRLGSKVGEKHPDAIERQLAHVEANQASEPMPRKHWDERVKATRRWPDNFDEMCEGGKTIRTDSGVAAEQCRASTESVWILIWRFLYSCWVHGSVTACAARPRGGWNDYCRLFGVA